MTNETTPMGATEPLAHLARPEAVPPTPRALAEWLVGLDTDETQRRHVSLQQIIEAARTAVTATRLAPAPPQEDRTDLRTDLAAASETWAIGRGRFNTVTNGEYIERVLTAVPQLLDDLDTAEGERHDALAEINRLHREQDELHEVEIGLLRTEVKEAAAKIARQRERLSSRQVQVKRLRSEVTRLHAEVAQLRAAPAPVKDEDAVVEAVTQAMMRLHECGYPVTLGSPDCEMHGVPFLDTHIGDVYGAMSESGGYCPVARRWAVAVLAVVREHLPTASASSPAPVAEQFYCPVHGDLLSGTRSDRCAKAPRGHSSADEECPCDPCTTYRDEEDPDD